MSSSTEMAIQEKRDLSPAEVKGFRRRYNQARLGLAAVGTGVVVLFFLASLPFLAWMVVLLIVGVVMLLLEVRGQRCPRCKGFVWWSGGPSDPSNPCSDTPGITLLQGPPERCRGCGVRLRTPNAERD